ncbi:MAG TPA: AMP-binding protein [Ilumatobacteraceae bacterium]|nr:AMP-binding protein [Ilumatobacteraceae bacterium]
MNLANIIDGHDADSVALIWRNRVTTYGELREQVAAFRGGLAASGVVADDRVALMVGNSPHFVIAYLATVGLGAVAVPLNPASPGPELQSELGVVAPRAVVVDPTGSVNWSNVDRAGVPSIEVVVVTDAAGATEGVVAFDDLLAAAPVEVVDVDDSQLAALMFTSGTAGSPRAAMLTHANLRANLDQSRSAQGHISADDVIYGVLPLFHIFGLNVVIGLGLCVGASIVLVQRFDPATAAQSIRDRGVTVIPGAPALWGAFAHFDELDGDTFSTVRLGLSGASRLPISVARTMQERFGIEIREGYGLTEASPIVTTSTGITPRFGSVGRALDGVEIRLVNSSGDALVGDVGEVWVRGENVFAGYFGDPEATAEVLDAEGWLHTGDMATTDDDGYLYLVDRSKDLIIVSGFNVFPAEVEEMLATHPAVAECAAVGVAHPHTGEAVKAYVVTAPGSDVDEEMLIEYSLDHLARYKCPSKVIFVDALPRNASGKLVRRNLDDALRVGAL